MKPTGILLIIIALAHPAAGQDSLAAARDLYAAASYEEALTTLARLSDGVSPDVARQVQQYRAFSLFALGRTVEAEQVAEVWTRQNPLVTLSGEEVSPRIESMFAAVRKRVLPGMIRDEYRIARASIDRADLKDAEPHLVLVSKMIADVRSTGAIDDTLSDLSLVVEGFLGLSRATAKQQGQQPPPQRETPAAANALAVNTAATAGAGAPLAGTLPAGTAPAARASLVYAGPATSNLAPPVTISQPAPDVPRNVAEIMRRMTRKNVVLEVLINEQGDVENAAIIEPLLDVYDAVVLRTARQWKYRPATLNGVPVKFRKAVTVDFVER